MERLEVSVAVRPIYGSLGFKRLRNQWRPLKTLLEQGQKWVKNVFLTLWILHCNVPNKGTTRACLWLLALTNCIFEAERSVTLRPAVVKISYQLIDISPLGLLPSCSNMTGQDANDATYVHFLWLHQTTLFFVTGPNSIEESSKVTLLGRNLDNPAVAQVVKKPSIFYEIRIFFTSLSGALVTVYIEPYDSIPHTAFPSLQGLFNT